MIRKAEERDIEDIAKVLTTAWKTAFSRIVDQEYSNNLPLEKYIQIFTNNIKENKEMIYINEEKCVNGFISGITSNEKYDCQIVGLYLLPDYQRKGVGTQLVQTMINYFQEKGKKNLIVWTIDGAKNNKFYEYFGFKKTEYKELEIGIKKYSGVGFYKQI